MKQFSPAILLTMLVLPAWIAAAPEASMVDSFPGLALFEPSRAKIYHSSTGSKRLVDPDAPITREEPEPVLETMLSGDQRCRIGFSWGPSEDPHYSIELQNKAGEWTWAGTISGETIVVPGNGFIYSQGRTNEMFDCRRKFRLTNNALEEVPQPFYRVDLKTVVKSEIELRSEPQGGEITARLGKGANIHVLINKDQDYLISTPLGLTGWFHLEEVIEPSSPIEGLYYAGD